MNQLKIQQELIIFRNFVKEPIHDWASLIEGSHNPSKNYYSLISYLLAHDITLYELLIQNLIEENHAFLNQLESKENLSAIDYASLKNDLQLIAPLFHQDYGLLGEQVNDNNQILDLIQKSRPQKPIYKAYYNFFKDITGDIITNNQCDTFVKLLSAYGYGQFTFYDAFYINEKSTFQPIHTFDPLPIDNLYAYQYQKEQLIKNTDAFVHGKPFYNVLLVGSSGTGKSSSVKAMVPLFENQKLKLLQIQKEQFHLLPSLMDHLIRSSFKFIIFIDDLSFETNEETYKYLKSFIEGSIMNEAKNIAFYVTSNRRHLIKEVRSDRENEIHMSDSIEEMTSLSDRFGLTLFYEAPNQKTFFEMIRNISSKYKLNITNEEIETQAREWSLEHGGMSGRIAEQFVKSLLLEK